MSTHPMILLVGLFALGSAGWAQSQPKPEINPLPKSLQIGEKSYELVFRDSPPDEFLDKPPKSLRFQTSKPFDGLDKSLRYWLEGASFVRSPDGRFALPFHGEAPFVGYIDLEKKSFIAFNDAFPPTGEHLGKSVPPRYRWVALLDEDPQPQALWLFVSLWNRETQKTASWRVRISFATPGQIQVVAMNGAAVLKVLARNDKEFIAQIAENFTWARIATDSWQVLAKGQPSEANDQLGRAAYSPDHREIYASYSGGLAIFNAEDGKELARPGVGQFANAFTLGATFDPGGSVAVVASPYAREIALMDVKTLRVLKRYQAATPLAGIVFDAKESKAFAIKTSLPYE